MMKPILIRVCFLLIGLTPCFTKAQDLLYVQRDATITIQDKALLIVQGNIHLDNSSKLNNQGALVIGHGAATAANWIDLTTSPYHYGKGLVSFSSNGSQSLASANTFGRLVVNNGGLNLQSNTVAEYWVLSQGTINTFTHLAIALTPTEEAIVASPVNTGFKKSWFNGSLRRFMVPSKVNTYTFPVGNSQRAYLAALDNLMANPLNVQYLDISFEDKPGSDIGLTVQEAGKRYTAVRNEGVWKLRSHVNQVTGSFDIKLDKEGFACLYTTSPGIVLRPLESANAADWTVPRNASPSYMSAEYANSYIYRRQISSLGQLGIGTIATNENTLPASFHDELKATDRITAGPNPAVSHIRIFTTNPVKQLKGYISHSSGKVVKQFTILNGGIINLADLNAGTYWITIPDLKDSGSNWQQKIILVK